MNDSSGRSGGTRRGFTLVELLVVVAIILILAMLLFPALRGAMGKSRTVLCAAHMKQLQLAYNTYANEHGGDLPSSFTRADGWSFGGTTAGDVTNGVIWPYLQDLRIYKCPLFASNAYFRSYSVNNFMDGDDGWMTTCLAAGKTCARRLSGVPRPSTTWVFCEEMDPRSWLQGSFVTYLNKDSWIDPIGYWHQDAVNFTFADGHVEYWKWDDSRTAIPAKSGTFYVAQANNPDLKRLQRATCPGVPGAPE